MKRLFLLVLAVCIGCASSDDIIERKAKRLAHETLILDTHIDVPYRLWNKMEDISMRTPSGEFDCPRAKEGGLDAVFMSIYVPSGSREEHRARALADSLIGMMEAIVDEHPDKFALARSTEEVKRNFEKGKVSFIFGIENGEAIEGDIENLAHFYRRGVRYITLTHAKDNLICDSSYDTTRTWHGLSPFGRDVVGEMNRLGIMVDVSHVSDEAFYQVLEVSSVPVIASHSSCRHFTPGWERNMSDDMIRALAEKGGVVQINFGAMFVDDECRKQMDGMRKDVSSYLSEHGLKRGSEEARAFIERYRREHPVNVGHISNVINHIEHVIKLVGIEHVGFGSDFEGVGGLLPEGLEDVSRYPNIVFELLKRGYTESEIRNICSENLLRVWAEVEQEAGALESATGAAPKR